MSGELMKFLAFIRRDWWIQSSYRLSFVTHLGQVVFTMASFFFIGKLVDPQHPALLEPYGGGYFPFVVLGLAGSRYLSALTGSAGGKARDEQLQGTLEAMLLSPTRFVTILVGGMWWDLCWTTVEVAAYLGIGAWVFGLDLSRINLLTTAVVVGLSIVCLAGLGVVSACGTLLFKDYDPVSWILEGLMKLAGGVYFPIGLLPAWGQTLAWLFPLTYVVEGLRQAVLTGQSPAALGGLCAALAVFGAAGWLLALLISRWTLERLKTTGALSFR